jgi:hypothetical protein
MINERRNQPLTDDELTPVEKWLVRIGFVALGVMWVLIIDWIARG